METPNLSVLLVSYNRADDLLALLESLKIQEDITKYVGEILILNNCSTISYSEIEKFIKGNPQLPISYTVHDENLGAARGRNYLMERAEYPYWLITDDDVEFEDPKAIEKISTIFEKEENAKNNVGLINFDIYYHQTRERQINAFPHKNYEKYKDKPWFLTYYFIAAGHVLKKEAFEKSGPYPTDFFYMAEEYDLGYRILDAGYTIAFDSSVQVFHKESPFGRVTNNKRQSLMWRNKSIVAYKYLPKKYFYTTSFLWIFEHLRKTKFDIKGVFTTLADIRRMAKNQTRQPLKPETLEYLKSVEARLWY